MPAGGLGGGGGVRDVLGVGVGVRDVLGVGRVRGLE
jgi:hypothetical protein